MSLTSFLVSVLPIFLISLYIYKKDSEKESSRLLLKLFIFGILSCFPAMSLGLFIGNFFPTQDNMNYIQLFFYIFVAVALVEEFCKWLFVYRISYNHNEFDTVYDMIVYSSFVALGFACFENILYVNSLGILTGFVRAVSAVPGHVCDGILMGFYLGLSKLNLVKGNISVANKYKFLSILVPVITHGIYDFCLFTENDLFVVFFLCFLITLYTICIRKIKELSQSDLMIKYKSNVCADCEASVNSNFCAQRGNKID